MLRNHCSGMLLAFNTGEASKVVQSDKMESLPNLSLLKFNEDTLQTVRREINLDKPGRMEEALNILEDWLKKQSHFTKKEFPREYLERTLVTTKGLLERAKVRLEKYCTFKTMTPEFFDHSDFKNSYQVVKALTVHAHLPKLTPENYRIYISRMITAEGDSVMMFKYFKYLIVLSEYLKTYDYTTGFVVIVDMADMPLVNFLSKLNIAELRQILTILMEGFGMRLKGIHFITSSKMIDSLVSILKSMLSEKIGNRIHVHRSVDSLYEHVPKECLPVEYGGTQRPLGELQDEWFKVLNTKEFQSYLAELSKAKVDETYKQTIKFNEEYIGMPGSFRTLSVD